MHDQNDLEICQSTQDVKRSHNIFCNPTACILVNASTKIWTKERLRGQSRIGTRHYAECKQTGSQNVFGDICVPTLMGTLSFAPIRARICSIFGAPLKDFAYSAFCARIRAIVLLVVVILGGYNEKGLRWYGNLKLRLSWESSPMFP